MNSPKIVAKNMIRQGMRKPRPIPEPKKEFTFEMLQEGLLAGIIIDNFEKRNGGVPDSALKSPARWFIYWHFNGGKQRMRNMYQYSQGVKDYIKWHNENIRC